MTGRLQKTALIFLLGLSLGLFSCGSGENDEAAEDDSASGSKSNLPSPSGSATEALTVCKTMEGLSGFWGTPDPYQSVVSGDDAYFEVYFYFSSWGDFYFTYESEKTRDEFRGEGFYSVISPDKILLTYKKPNSQNAPWTEKEATIEFVSDNLKVTVPDVIMVELKRSESNSQSGNIFQQDKICTAAELPKISWPALAPCFEESLPGAWYAMLPIQEGQKRSLL